MAIASACTARGLLVEDGEYASALTEAVDNLASARHLRELFAVILLKCEPARPDRLWDLFKADLSSDFTSTRRQTELDLCTASFQDADGDESLREIGTILSINGRCLTDWPMLPQLPDVMADQIYYIRDQLEDSSVSERILQLYPAQKALYDEIIAAINDNGPARDRTFFIHGAGE